MLLGHLARSWGDVWPNRNHPQTAFERVRDIELLEDAGSHVDPATGKRVGFGVPFSGQAVRDTFANATGYNEWNVAHADTIGLHPSDPWDVARPMKLSDVPRFDPSLGDGTIVGAVTITLPEIMTAFPGLPIYSLSGGEIVKVEPGDQGARCHAVDPAELYR